MAIRQIIYKSHARVTAKGRKIPGNGLDKYNAIIRRGKRILIDVDRYAAWLAGREV